MKKANVFNINVDDRVREAVNNGMNIYVNKLINGFIEPGLEATFQLHFAKIIDDLLQTSTYDINERFQVCLERNMPINGNKDYIDIVIKYHCLGLDKLYLIELKFKKITDSAPDLGTIYSYQDMFNLDSHHVNTPNVAGCYFIFLTDLQTYLNKPNRGTRVQLPMEDKATIQPNHVYKVTGKAAKKAMKGYLNNGFKFSHQINIEYQHFSIQSKDYWFFIEEI